MHLSTEFYKFNYISGFEVGESIYSFNVQKKGYVAINETTNKVAFGSGDKGNFLMQIVTDQFLWLTVLDAKTGSLLENVEVNIKGKFEK